MSKELTEGTWLNQPEEIRSDSDGLLVTAKAESDFWNQTGYGFTRATGHALLNDFPQDSSIEVTWLLDYSEQFDQAGLMAWADQDNWIKAGVEFADGVPQLGAVVTLHNSDWSVAPVPKWMNRLVSLRFSRSGDALTIRAKVEGGSWELVRLAPLNPELNWRVGLFCASPSRAGLTVRFTALRRGAADETLH